MITNMSGTRAKRIMALITGIGTVAFIIFKILHDGLMV
jgi:hypothetical protein